MDIVTEKKCTECGETKTLDGFSNMKQGKYGKHSWCKKCACEKSKEWGRKNPARKKILYKTWVEKHPEQKIKADHTSGRRYRLKTEYGITVQDYEDMFLRQNGMCAICGSNNGGRTLHIDHNHNTNKVRGLLCLKCNRGMGLFDDNIEKMEMAIGYLRFYKEAQ